MPLYALDDDDLIHAGEATAGKAYHCPDCFGPLKRRAGRWRFPHFYHLKATPSCRLYSKSEDHLLAQLELQKLFPQGEIQLEKPFLAIDRVADACWEKEKIVFEVQCSQLTDKEGEMRIRDYRSIGYEAVWLLDDKRYNKRTLRPAEEFLRRYSTYFVSVGRGAIYDQFEIFSRGARIRRGKRMPIDLRKVGRGLNKGFNEERFPKQVVQLAGKRYFYGDRLHRALQNYPLAMLQWRALELQLTQPVRKENKLWQYVRRRYLFFLENFSKNWGG
ncbi:MAG: competence protein CoiA family protein [Chlamydiales bacterium]